MRWDKAINGGDLTWRDTLSLVQYYDGVFRAQVFVMSLSVALLAFAKAYQRYAILGLCSLLILITMLYSTYIMVQLTRVLRKCPYYTKATSAYYFVATMVLFLIGLFVILNVDWEVLLKERRLRFNLVTKDDTPKKN